MPDIPQNGLTPHDESGVDPGAVPGGTSIPFHAERFGSSSHITPSIPTVEVPSHTQLKPGTNVLISRTRT